MKKITQDQIKAVIGTFYQTNISASAFDSVKKFFDDLPDVEDVKPETK